jgi:hypothetical protein
VRAACLLLKVVQSVEVKSPLTPLAAVGMLIVKLLVEKVELVAMLKSVPVVPVDTLLTILLGNRTLTVPAEIEALKVDAEVEVVTLIVFCLPLKVVQSVEDKQPVTVEEELGQLKVMEEEVVATLKVVPDVPVATCKEATLPKASVTKS